MVWTKLLRMSLHPAVQAKNSNGVGRRNFDREMGSRTDSKSRPGRSSSGSFGNAGLPNGGKVTYCDGPSRDRLVYVTTCLLGHSVDVQVKNGSVYSGIFHTMNTEREPGVVLKMARLVKDVSSRGSKSPGDSISKPPSKIFIIPGKEVVQIVAKDVSMRGDGLPNGHIQDKKHDILIDSSISQPSHSEERELERWVPDVDDPQCSELENIFHGTWNRNWDQFETNKTLFGVKSTFDEELYTTKLDRGPQMRELEREAIRIAREIEGEETEDIHLAEERGQNLNDDLDIDEETRFSSVNRGVDDGSYEENKDTHIDSINNETFGASRSSALNRSFSDVIKGKLSSTSEDEGTSTLFLIEAETTASTDDDKVKHQSFGSDLENARLVDADSRFNESQHLEESKHLTESKTIAGENLTLESEDTHQLLGTQKSGYIVSIHTPSSVSNSLQGPENIDHLGDSDLAGSNSSVRQPSKIRARPSSSASSASEHAGAASAASGSGLSPSSVGSLSSEKSTLNPNAKEFKLNPNAKSFTPSSSFKSSGASDSSFYYPVNVSAVPPIPSLPMGIGMGPSFGGHQPVIYNPQGVPVVSHQGYIHPNGPMYQQMYVGQPRPMLYAPNYPPDMHYK